jgi:hypothetical protein
MSFIPALAASNDTLFYALNELISGERAGLSSMTDNQLASIEGGETLINNSVPLSGGGYLACYGLPCTYYYQPDGTLVIQQQSFNGGSSSNTMMITIR